jgi:hypothetical protein
LADRFRAGYGSLRPTRWKTRLSTQLPHEAHLACSWHYVLVERWAERMQRKADQRDERYRQHQEAVRSGAEAPSPGDQLTFERYRQLIELLTGGPVSGPDQIPILICINNSLLGSRVPESQMPASWLAAIARETTTTGKVARLAMVLDSPRFAYAYTLSGPPRQLSHRFKESRIGHWEDPVSYVLSLGEDVRVYGVQALNRV